MQRILKTIYITVRKEVSFTKKGGLMTKNGSSTIGDVIKPGVLEALGFKKRSPTTDLDEEKERRHYLYRSKNMRGVWSPKYDTSSKTRTLSEKEKELIMTTPKETVKLLLFNAMWNWPKVLDHMLQLNIPIKMDAPITSKNLKTYFQDALGLPKEKVNSVGPRLAEIYQRLGLTEPICLIREDVMIGKTPSIYYFTAAAEASGYQVVLKRVINKLPYHQRIHTKKRTQTVTKAVKRKKVIHGDRSMDVVPEELRNAGVKEVTFKL